MVDICWIHAPTWRSMTPARPGTTQRATASPSTMFRRMTFSEEMYSTTFTSPLGSRRIASFSSATFEWIAPCKAPGSYLLVIAPIIAIGDVRQRIVVNYLGSPIQDFDNQRFNKARAKAYPRVKG